MKREIARTVVELSARAEPLAGGDHEVYRRRQPLNHQLVVPPLFSTVHAAPHIKVSLRHLNKSGSGTGNVSRLNKSGSGTGDVSRLNQSGSGTGNVSRLIYGLKVINESN